MTTADKIEQLLNESAAFDIFSIDPATVAPEARDLVLTAQAVLGHAGVNPAQLIGLAIPSDPAEADVMIDKIISFFVELRGDDLPPFDFSRYGEAEAA